ncbi:hypothetical protein GCM10027405_39030 [Arthrobacter alkaliphilus]
MEVIESRILLHPSEPERSHRFYRDTLGLAIYREKRRASYSSWQRFSRGQWTVESVPIAMAASW